MHRYLSSFIISAIAYIAIIATIFYLFSKNDYSTKKVQKKTPRSVQFSIIAPAKVKEIKPIKEKKKKLKSKPKKKKKPKPKPKPIVKPKSIIKEPIVELEPLIKEPVVKEAVIVEQAIEDQTIEDVIEDETVEDTQAQEIVRQQINQDKREAKQREFIEHLIKKINSNKSYPRMARRRGVEGVVDVKFTILSDGSVENIQIVEGRSIFKKATIQAIERSFPIEVDSSIFDFPEIFKVKIAYVLK